MGQITLISSSPFSADKQIDPMSLFSCSVPSHLVKQAGG